MECGFFLLEKLFQRVEILEVCIDPIGNKLFQMLENLVVWIDPINVIISESRKFWESGWIPLVRNYFRCQKAFGIWINPIDIKYFFKTVEILEIWVHPVGKELFRAVEKLGKIYVKLSRKRHSM